MFGRILLRCSDANQLIEFIAVAIYSTFFFILLPAKKFDTKSPLKIIFEFVNGGRRGKVGKVSTWWSRLEQKSEKLKSTSNGKMKNVKFGMFCITVNSL